MRVPRSQSVAAGPSTNLSDVERNGTPRFVGRRRRRRLGGEGLVAHCAEQLHWLRLAVPGRRFQGGDRNLDVDNRLGRKVGYGRRADVVDAQRYVTERVVQRIRLLAEEERPTGVVGATTVGSSARA